MRCWTYWANLGKRFWADEAALTVCSEAVLVGTVAVLAVTTGLSIAVDAFGEEALDYASALRSLNQGYHVDGYLVPGAYTEPSGFVQTPQQVQREVERFRQAARRRIERERRDREAFRRRLKQQLESGGTGDGAAGASTPQAKERSSRGASPTAPRRPGAADSRRRQPDAGRSVTPDRPPTPRTQPDAPASGIRAERNARPTATGRDSRHRPEDGSLDPRVPLL